jgi:hypothetical protein
LVPDYGCGNDGDPLDAVPAFLTKVRPADDKKKKKELADS